MKPTFNQNYKGIRCRVYLVKENPSDEVISINNSSDAYDLVRDELVSSDRERFLSVMLNVKNHLIGVETVSIGSVTAAIITPTLVFRSALLAGSAVSVIFAHNHVSGDLEPSSNDLETTKKLIEAGELLGIKVLDHLIVSSQGYKSFRDSFHQIQFPS
jgi:DNA repair protein RadC